MLDFDSIKTTASKSTIDDRLTCYRAGVTFSEKVDVFNHLNTPTEEVEKRLKRQIWYAVYGDLAGPISEMSYLLLRHVDCRDMERARKVVERVQSMLKML